MKISFIIPCYNVERYIERCIMSIVNLNEQNIEIIAIDDGSRDTTVQILKQLKLKHDIIIIENDSPSGYAGRCRNQGIEVASGDFLAFIDSDDYYIDNSIIKSYELYNNYDIIINSYMTCNSSGKILDKVKHKDQEVDRRKFLWRQIQNVCNQRTLFKRSFIECNKIMYYEDCRAQDLLFLYSAYICGAKVRLTSMYTTIYLEGREDSVSNVISDKYFETSIIAYDRFLDIIDNKLCTREVNSAISEQFLGFYLKVRKNLTYKQKEQLRASKVYEYIKANIVN